MNLSVIRKEENPLLKRVEVDFEVGFDGAIPSRDQVRQAIAAALSASADLIMIVKLENTSGIHKAVGFARIYENTDALKQDQKHLLLRDKLIEKEDKKDEKQQETKK